MFAVDKRCIFIGNINLRYVNGCANVDRTFADNYIRHRCPITVPPASRIGMRLIHRLPDNRVPGNRRTNQWLAQGCSRFALFGHRLVKESPSTRESRMMTRAWPIIHERWKNDSQGNLCGGDERTRFIGSIDGGSIYRFTGELFNPSINYNAFRKRSYRNITINNSDANKICS